MLQCSRVCSFCCSSSNCEYFAVLAWCSCMQFSPSALDAKAYSTLASLPADDQASALRQFFATNIAAMKNPSAYLAGVVRSIRGSSGRGDAVPRGTNSAVSKQLDYMHKKYGAVFSPSPAGSSRMRRLHPMTLCPALPIASAESLRSTLHMMLKAGDTACSGYSACPHLPVHLFSPHDPQFGALDLCSLCSAIVPAGPSWACGACVPPLC